MQPQKPKQNSRGQSCLTCRKRRKKCDRSRPACERCITGGFQCLGYYTNAGEDGDRTSRAQIRLEVTTEKGESSKINSRRILPKPAETISYTRQQQQAVRSRVNTSSGSSLDAPAFGSLLGPSAFFSENLSLRECPVLSTSEPAQASHLDSTRGTAPTIDHDITTPVYSAENRFDGLQSQNQSQSLTRSATCPRQAPAVHYFAGQSPATSGAIGEFGQVMNILCRALPRSVNSNASMRRSHFTFTVGQYNFHLVRRFFQPLPASMADMIATRLMQSGTNSWLLYMSVKLFEQLNKSPRNVLVRPFVYWINRCEQQITNTLDPDCSVEELGDRLLGLLELVFLKFMTINTRAGYSLLKRSLPTFFALLSTDSSFWTESQGILRVSFARALNCPRFEIRRFVFFDMMISFASGIPSLVQYDTSDFPVIPAVTTPLEWVHGISTELAASIVQVNSWRASNPGIPNAIDSAGLELRVRAWIPRTVQLVGEDSLEVVVRLAVQESWRQAILIYTYMGMSCANSHDPRIQHAVQQIIQLSEVVSGSRLDVHLLLPALTAGVAARYEEQRVTVRNILSSFRDTRVWLFPGMEFTTVLDHLWHGVAAGGAPVNWEDYVLSRRTVYPLT